MCYIWIAQCDKRCVEAFKIPELEDEGIKFELDALGLMREMSPKEYDEITNNWKTRLYVLGKRKIH